MTSNWVLHFWQTSKHTVLDWFKATTDIFQKTSVKSSWIQNPFADTEIAPKNFTATEKEQVYELNCDSELQQKFYKILFVKFWVERRGDYAQAADKAVKFLLLFINSYLCETAFFSLVYLKNKYRNEIISEENDLRLKLSNFRPDLPNSASNLQAQPSHWSFLLYFLYFPFLFISIKKVI